jgi:trehalose 6-phosphate phosphatase
MILAPASHGIVDVPNDIANLIVGSEQALALFLDLDGTLVEIAPTPDVVVVPSELPAILRQAETALGGALAIVTGRPLDDIDRLLAPTVVASVAGIHGGEIRIAPGAVKRVPAPAWMPQLRTRVFEAMSHIPGVLIEDKGASIAVHFRQTPERAAEVHKGLLEVVALQADRFRVLPGKMVFEVMPRAFRKDAAVAMFMEHPPFHGRRPIFIGDDRSDDDAIAEVVRRGGVGLRVGNGAEDGSDFDGPEEVRRWLSELPSQIERVFSPAR